jgi:hypothetical protein
VSPGAAPRVPASTETTKRVHFRTLLRGRASVMGGTLAAAAVFVFGASQSYVGIMLLGPVAVALVVAIACYVAADRRAEEEFFKAYSGAHGLTWSPKWSVYELTPLLGGGDRRKFRNWMEGPLGGDAALAGGLGWFTFEVRQDNGDKPDTWTPYNFTISIVDLEEGIHRFPGIYLRRRRGLFAKLDSDGNWLSMHRLKKIELESTAFCEKYELWVEQDQDEVVLRQLFSPRFVVWLAEHPLAPGFEYRAGTLCVFLPDHCGEAGRLDFFLMGVREIAKRVQAEIAEARDAGARAPFAAGPGPGAAS